MSDILTKNVKQSPVLIVTIISKYRCKRCHRVFNRISKATTRLEVGSQDNDTKAVCNMVVDELEKISASRDNQMHFCNRDKDDGSFTNRIDVVDYIKYRINNKESIEVGPAEYLGSNIIKDKLSIDIGEKEIAEYNNLLSRCAGGFTYSPEEDSNEINEKISMNFGGFFIPDPSTNSEEGQ